MDTSYSHGRASRLASTCPKDFDFEFFVYANEAQYTDWWTQKRLEAWFKSLPNATAWNAILCIMVLINIIFVQIELNIEYLVVQDYFYNLFYAFHVAAMAYEYKRKPETRSRVQMVGFVVDAVTYMHYPLMLAPKMIHKTAKVIFYNLRLHRPFRYLWSLNDYNLTGSVIGTTLKYIYMLVLARVFFVLVWVYSEYMATLSYSDSQEGGSHVAEQSIAAADDDDAKILYSTPEGAFFIYYYIVDKVFFPIGPEMSFEGDTMRFKVLAIMITGCFLVSGAAVASLALVIALLMRAEEEFRARFRLIMKDMHDTRVPPELQQKVETFYRMYWHKQKAVSVTQLLPIFPPTLSASVYTDIYFEAQQKSLILRDLSYQFLWEVAKVMSTIHYIPGDAIIQRSTTKSSIIYITYGDVEMLTAEDDDTPILRMTRGTILSPCGGCMSMACGRALVQIRAATFCTAHVLDAADLWRVAEKHGKHNGQAFILLSAFEEHFEKVKRHYRGRVKHPVKYKSSILQFKRNLIALKEAKDEAGNLLLARSDFFLQIAGCYYMRNRADSSLTEESDAICLRPTFPCILQPQSSLLIFWHSMMSCVICAVGVTHPYHIVYVKDTGLHFRFFDYVITGIFTLDLLVHLSTGANVEEGVPLTFLQTSSQQVSSPWFLVDVVATLPILEFVGDGSYAGLNKLLRIPKVFRMLKSLEDLSVYHSNVLRFMSYTLMLIIACWLVACLNQGIRCFYFRECILENSNTQNWVAKSENESLVASVREQVAYGLYWATSLVTFTSHKDGHKIWNSRWYFEFMVFIMVLLEFCGILKIFIEAVYSATIIVTTAMRDDYDSLIESVNNFLVRNHMESRLTKRFITYLELCWYTDKAYSITHQKKSIWFDLPPHVYQDIVAIQRNQYILCIPFMQYLNIEQLKYVCSHARLFYTSPNEILLNTGDVSSEIYVIKRGFCEMFNPETKKVFALISENHVFGDVECLLRFPAYYTVRAVTHVQVFSISRKHLTRVMEMPKMKDAIQFIKKQQVFRRVQKRREQFMEYEPPVPSPNLARFPLPRKHIPDSDFLQPFSDLGLFSVLRYIFPRFTIRPDGKYIMRYEWFRGLTILITALLCPIFFTLVLQYPKIFYLALATDILAMLDICQRMLVGYYNEDGILIYHPAATAAHYIKGAFITDLLACLPIERFEAPHHESANLPRRGKYLSTEILQFLCLNRLLQLYRLPHAMEVLSVYIRRRDVLVVIKLIPVYLILVNMAASLIRLHSVDIYVIPEGDPPYLIVVPDGSWLKHFGDKVRYNISETPFNLHLTILYWVVYETTTVGYNIFQPSSFDQIILLTVCKIIAAVVIIYFSVVIISIRANVNKLLASYQGNMRDITVFMDREELSKDLKNDVLAYYNYKWIKTGGMDYRNVLKLCDQITLRTDAILHTYGNTFMKNPILHHCDVSLLRILGRAAHSHFFDEGTSIIGKDDVIINMYFIDYGTVEIRDSMDSDAVPIKITRGSVFGNLDAVSTTRCPNSIVAGTSVHLLQINALVFHAIVSEFTTVRVLMKKYRPNQENYIIATEGSSMMKMKAKRSTSRISIPFIATNQQKNIFSSRSTVMQIYLITICMSCVYADVYNAGFNDNRLGLIVALYALDVAFYFKILVKTTMYGQGEELKEGVLSSRSRNKYIRGEFIYDVLSCLPFELFCLISKEHKWRIFSMARLNRLFRITTVNKCLERHLERLSANLVLTTIFTVSLYFSLFIHTMTCTWYAIGIYEENRQANSSWFSVHDDEGHSICQNMYFCSLYFILTTFLQCGLGDVLPMQRSEVIFTILLQLVCFLMYMVYVGEFSNIIQYQSFRPFDYYYKYLELQEFLKNNRVSTNLVRLINKYSVHLWRETRGLQVPYFLDIAPLCLKLNVMSAVYMHHLTNHNIFKDCEPAFLRQLVGCLTLYTYCEGIFVVKDGEITDSMYMVHRGKVQEVDEDMDEVAMTSTNEIFGPGQHFGIMEGLQRDVPYTYSYRTISKAQVLTLRLDSWEYLLYHFPISRYSIYKHVPGHPFNRPPPQKSVPQTKPETQQIVTGTELTKDVTKSEKLPSSAEAASTLPLTDSVPTSVPPLLPTTEDTKLDNLPESVQEPEEIQEMWPMHSRRRSTVYDIKQFMPETESDHDINLNAKSEPTLDEPTQSEPTLVSEPSHISSTESLMPTKIAPSPLIRYAEYDMDDEEEEKTELEVLKSVAPIESVQKQVEKQEIVRDRRKTLFEKFSSSAKKFVEGSGRELDKGSKDSLLLEEEREATAALLETLDIEDETEPKQIDKEDTDKIATSLKGVGLSFRPGAREDEDEDEDEADDDDLKSYTKKYSRKSVLPGLAKEDEEEDEVPTRRGRGLSFLPGLIQRDSEEQSVTSETAPGRSILTESPDKAEKKETDKTDKRDTSLTKETKSGTLESNLQIFTKKDEDKQETQTEETDKALETKVLKDDDRFILTEPTDISEIQAEKEKPTIDENFITDEDEIKMETALFPKQGIEDSAIKESIPEKSDADKGKDTTKPKKAESLQIAEPESEDNEYDDFDTFRTSEDDKTLEYYLQQAEGKKQNKEESKKIELPSSMRMGHRVTHVRYRPGDENANEEDVEQIPSSTELKSPSEETTAEDKSTEFSDADKSGKPPVYTDLDKIDEPTPFADADKEKKPIPSPDTDKVDEPDTSAVDKDKPPRS